MSSEKEDNDKEVSYDDLEKTSREDATQVRQDMSSKDEVKTSFRDFTK